MVSLIVVFSFVGFAATITLSGYLILQAGETTWGIIVGAVAWIAAMVWATNLNFGSPRSGSSAPEGEAREKEPERAPPLSLKLDFGPPKRPAPILERSTAETPSRGDQNGDQNYQNQLKTWEEERLGDLEKQRLQFDADEAARKADFELNQTRNLETATAAERKRQEKEHTEKVEKQRKEFEEDQIRKQREADKEQARLQSEENARVEQENAQLRDAVEAENKAEQERVQREGEAFNRKKKEQIEKLEKQIKQKESDSQREAREAYEADVRREKERFENQMKLYNETQELYKQFMNDQGNNRLFTKYERQRKQLSRQVEGLVQLQDGYTRGVDELKENRIKLAKSKRKEDWKKILDVYKADDPVTRIQQMATKFRLDLNRGYINENQDAAVEELSAKISDIMQKATDDELKKNWGALGTLLEFVGTLEPPPEPQKRKIDPKDYEAKADTGNLKRELSRLKQTKPPNIKPAQLKTFTPKQPKQIKPKEVKAKAFKPPAFKFDPSKVKTPSAKFKPQEFKAKPFGKAKPAKPVRTKPVDGKKKPVRTKPAELKPDATMDMDDPDIMKELAQDLGQEGEQDGNKSN